MIKVGHFNNLTITEALPFAFLLSDANDARNVTLNTPQAPKDAKIGDELEVFVFYGETGELCGQTTPPKLTEGQSALLTAVGVTEFAAFFDWGLERDLMVLKRDQERPVAEGLQYLVHVYHDNDSQRLLGQYKTS